ncbi:MULTISPECIES: ATP-dependent DNA helicase [Thermoanaerobacterium]|uniref:DEAD/DEAH box helicase n=2 Tax=Thermoanaerobacterium TaxID=28895 RepID=W9E983_9THEO|nr:MULTISPECIES: ATP-dependent DNA helicase [Thermoanaerobacterium]AFK86392.1 DEAD2 domain-containing protein [Thermoanaerobacterium saccharolyticum JW/SL-YS485]ETO38488.1 DEAD/DEAH box helicase [Thermoanaerobacterium aotearoense SCUT27]
MVKEKIKISVRDMVEFILRCGDLNDEFLGSSNLRALEGTKIHKKIQSSKGENYKKEVTLRYEREFDEFIIVVEGRADGIIVDDGNVTIDEIKTTSANIDEIDEAYNPLHLAQAKCYAYIYSIQNSLNMIDIQLTYYQVDDGDMKFLRYTYSLDELKIFFDDLIEKYYYWASMLYNWIRERNSSIDKMDFPYKDFRKGQKKLMVAVYKAIENGKNLFAEAPTGIGKTISTIFPSLKAMKKGLTSKIFYLTAKTIARTVAEETFNTLRTKGLKAKTLVLTAKEKICFNEKTECRPEACMFAKGHFDRINDALVDIFLNEDNFNRSKIEEYAKKHMVCPFEFSLDLSLWSDVIICDYNYVFDPNVGLKRFFQEKTDFTLLVDEAHNLVDRSREMFSAELFKKDFLSLKKEIKGKSIKLEKSLSKINSIFLKLKKRCGEKGYFVTDEIFSDLNGYLKQFIGEAELFLSNERKPFAGEAVTDLYFEVIRYLKVSDMYNESYTTYVEKKADDLKVKLFCLDPSKLLNETLEKVRSTVFFSATLIPMAYYMSLLGGNRQDYGLRLDSPFDIKNRMILIANDVSTKYKDREKTSEEIVEYIHTVVSKKKGNYIVYFPSYEYLNMVYDIYKERGIGYLLKQESAMMENEKDDFLRMFEDGRNGVLAFCVLGGAFSEGIDLAKDRLIGVIIIGVGIPQICLERDIIREHFERKYGQGYEYAYLYPGFNKVMQSAGRVIRTEEDKGIILLIDERFLHKNYIKIFPKEWFPYTKVNKSNLGFHLDSFWGNF